MPAHRPASAVPRLVAARIGLCAAAALYLAGCANVADPRTNPGSGSAGGGSLAARIGPGMNAQGEVVEPRKVEPGYGQKVKGLGDWEGEITGKPVPGSKFAQLKIGMTASEAQGLLGAPSDFGAQATIKAFIPGWFGADKSRYQAVYKGQGRLLFSSAGAGGQDKMHLVWIIHSAHDDGQR